MKPKSHEDFRASVCVCCHKAGVERVVKDHHIELIRKKVFSGYSLEDFTLPYGLCCSCRHSLISNPNFSVSIDYGSLSKSMKRNESSNDRCDCYICSLGRSKKKTSLKKQKPGPKPKNGEPSEVILKSIKVCPKCSQVIGRGKPHPCQKRLKPSNILKLAGNEKVKEKICNKVLQSFKGGDGFNNNISLSSTNGKPLDVTLGSKVDSVTVTHEKLDQIRRDGKLSDTKMSKVILPHIRSIVGKANVESNYEKNMIELTHEMKYFLTAKSLDFKIGNDTQSLVAFVCEDVQDLVEKIRLARNISKEDLHVKIGADTGGDFVKITLSVLDKSKFRPGVKICGDSDNSVSKLMLIGCVQKVPENYHNVSLLFNEIRIQDIAYPKTYCGDQKILNIICGIQGHRSAHPCPYCVAKSPFDENAEKRTLEMLKGDLKARTDKEIINSVVNPCLLVGEPTDLVLSLFPPCELHLMLRSGNYLCDHFAKDWKMRCPELETDPVIQFAKEHHIVRAAYHGGGFEGNQMKKMLDKHEELLAVVPEESKPFVECLAALKMVVDSSFGIRVSPDYKELILKFEEKYKSLPIHKTPSIHSVISHVKDFYDLHGTDLGLGFYSEQSTEAAHSDFLNSVWLQGYKVPDTHPKYRENLLNAGAKYNSRHLK